MDKAAELKVEYEKAMEAYNADIVDNDEVIKLTVALLVVMISVCCKCPHSNIVFSLRILVITKLKSCAMMMLNWLDRMIRGLWKYFFFLGDGYEYDGSVKFGVLLGN